MSNYGFGGSSGGNVSAAERAQMIDQVKNQIAMANAQELVQKMTNKCFVKCISYPSPSLDKKQQGCMTSCVERYMETWNIISKAYGERVQKDRVGMN